MQPRLLHITFPYAGPWAGEMARDFRELAVDIGAAPGLVWKVWTESREQRRAGGTYLFRSAEAADSYLQVHLARLAAFGIVDARVEKLDVNMELSALNKAFPQELPATTGRYPTLVDAGHQGMDRFLQTFSREGQVLRRAHGSLGSAVWGVRGDPGRAMVLIDWTDERSFQNFRDDPAVPATMRQGGATRPPVFTVLDGMQARFMA